MLRSLGFITGSLLVGATLYVIAQSPGIVQKTGEGTLTQQDLSQALDQSKQSLQQSLQQPVANEKPITTAQPKENYKTEKSATAQTKAAVPIDPEQQGKSVIEETIETASNQKPPSAPDQKSSSTVEKTIQRAIDSAAALSKELKSAAILPVAPLAKEEPRENTFRSKTPDTTPTPIPNPTDKLAILEQSIGPPAQRTPLDSPEWYPVWDGFRSEISAKGFSNQLARQSGRELRVERVGTGRYQVQMRYQNEDDLQMGLQQIGIKTGLKLSERTL